MKIKILALLLLTLHLLHARSSKAEINNFELQKKYVKNVIYSNQFSKNEKVFKLISLIDEIKNNIDQSNHLSKNQKLEFNDFLHELRKKVAHYEFDEVLKIINSIQK